MNERLWSSSSLGLSIATLMLLCATAPAASAQTFFEDGFESGDLSHLQNGFKWGSSNSVSVVRDDQYRVWASGTKMEDGPYEAREWENAPESDGRHTLRFNYGAGKSMSEQRFSLGSVYPEIWVSYWIRVPNNFSHPNTKTANNLKFNTMWTRAYSGEDSVQATLNLWHDKDNPGGSRLTLSGSLNRTGVSHSGSVPFISVPEDRGRWMQFVYRIRIASGEGANDGVMQVWRRWERESEFTQLMDFQDRNYWPDGSLGGPKGFTAGYLMGWANDAFPEDTEFLFDNVIVSSTPLLEIGAFPESPVSVQVE